MKDVLKKLVESEVLTDETRKELQEAISTEIEKQVNERVDVAKAKLTEEYKEKFFEEREKLVEALDQFLDENIKGALAESIREEYKEKFFEEREKLVEALDRFLSIELKKYIEAVRPEKDMTAKAFYESVKTLMLGEQDIPSEAEKIIKGLQESLRKKEKRANELMEELMESRKAYEGLLLESKINDVIRSLPNEKKALGRRLLEGVSLEEFDHKAQIIASELLTESESGGEYVDEDTPSEEVIVESTTPKVEIDFELERIRQLSGVK